MRVVAERVEAAAAGSSVRQVAVGRNEERDAGGCRALFRAYEERHVVLGRVSAEARRIDAALQVVGQLELETDLPLRIFEVVVVEVDGAVLPGRPLEVHLETGPVAAGDAARWKV